MLKLIQNETIKTFKKTSTKLMIIFAILALLAGVRSCKISNAYGTNAIILFTK
ncbi:MAG: hypothetical protein HFJ50_03270 [Clostridia bacterium]|jgi:hypothetical protein|nr:hypothetical protein [Clostridia bacterium]